MRLAPLLISLLLHGGLAVLLWSLHGAGAQISLGILEVVPVGESVRGSSPDGLPISQRSSRSESGRMEPAPTPERSHAAQSSGESPSTRVPVPEPIPGAGIAKTEMEGAKSSRAGTDGASALPGGGYQVRPAYPEAARRMGIEGTTLLKVRILEDGSVGKVIVAKSAGHPALDRSAVEAVQLWRFEPARRGGQPISVWANLPIRFRLE